MNKKAIKYLIYYFYFICILVSIYMYMRLENLGVKGYSWIIPLSFILNSIATISKKSLFSFLAVILTVPFVGFLFSLETMTLGLVFLSHLALGTATFTLERLIKKELR